MNYFLLKTEPSVYSYDDLVREKKTIWSGVSAAPALIHIRKMQKGDLTFIYHSGKEKQIIGIAEIISHPYPDPALKDDKRVVVDIRAKRKLTMPVTLSAIKMDKALSGMPLVRISRLSVMPVTKNEWERILSLSE